MANDWTAVIPVKRLDAAKSRLRGAVPDAFHPALALAMVRDTVVAVLACPVVGGLLVVTDDPAVGAAVTALGASVVPDEPQDGLNAAMRFGADVSIGLGRRRAVLAGDLPALRPEELGAALLGAAQFGAAQLRSARLGSARRAAQGRSFVPDADGRGTVLLAAPAGVPLRPLFGPGSAAAHAASGARSLDGDWPGLRHDVDTAADLATVLALGAGPHTCALLRDLGLTADCGSPAAGAR